MRRTVDRRRLTWVLLGFAAAFLIGVVYAQALRAAGRWETGLDWERALLLRIDRTVPDIVDRAMLVLPWLGTNLTLMPVLVVVALWLWRWRGRANLAVQLIVVQLGSLLLNALLKGLFDRPRPELWEPRGQYKWAAFPSGHAIVGVSVMFTIAFLLHREKGWRWPYVVVGALLVVNLYSRLYLGVHWPSDVFGGIVIGCVWLMATLHAFRPEWRPLRSPHHGSAQAAGRGEPRGVERAAGAELGANRSTPRGVS
jgi:undecaprenyl-diphosphatase